MNASTANLVPAGKMARLLDMTTERLRQLARDGVIPPAAKGGYPLVATVQGYLKWLADPERRSSRPAADLASAREREVRLRLAERESELIDVEDFEAFHAFSVGVYRDATAGLGASAVADPVLAAAVDQAVAAAIDRYDARFRAALPVMIRGDDPVADQP